MRKNLWLLSGTLDEATSLSGEEQLARAETIKSAHDPEGLAELALRLRRFVKGDEDCSALEFYRGMERCTPLVLFHTFLRKGERNMNDNGLQQSYGDHNRLLMLGLDMFEAENVEWTMGRRWRKPCDVDENDIIQCIQAFQDVGFDRETTAAMWVAGALHDYGKIYRRGFGLDAEDAQPLCRALYETLCPAHLFDLIDFTVRNHDLIEYVVTGETPATFIKTLIEEIPAESRRLAFPMLAAIQLVGAASLGEGRITRRKMEIYLRCLDGQIVGDVSNEGRLGRLLFGEQVVVESGLREKAAQALASLGEEEEGLLRRFLSDAVLHDWDDVRDMTLETAPAEQHTDVLLRALVSMARLWCSRYGDHTHVVLRDGVEMILKHAQSESSLELNDSGVLSTTLLNDTRAMILR